MLDSFASRLRTCRTITGLKSKDIVEALNKRGLRFTSRQYSRWEIHEVSVDRLIKNEILECVVDILNDHGLPELSSEWLLYGKGPTPILVDLSTTPDEEKAFYISRSLGKNYKLITIVGNYAEPVARSGEQIIIHYVEPEKLENRIVFLTTKTHTLYVGILENKSDSIIINMPKESVTIDRKEIEYCGRIIWAN